jgi:hypothetical protein
MFFMSPPAEAEPVLLWAVLSLASFGGEDDSPPTAESTLVSFSVMVERGRVWMMYETKGSVVSVVHGISPTSCQWASKCLHDRSYDWTHYL